MTYDADVYSSPEKFGLRFVGSISDPDADYSFHLLCVWQETGGEGRLLWGEDSGCSCPSPFENVGIDDLKEATGGGWAAFFDAVGDFEVDTPSEYRGSLDADKTELLAKVYRLAL